MSLEPGSSFGPYRIVGPLGRGGMAAVYRAHDPVLEREVALKVLPPEFLHDPAFAERFRQEARVAARLEHPNVVPVHAFGIDEGRPWMAMRLLDGGSLSARLDGGPLPPTQAAAVLRDVAAALDYAHARGVVHRDVKPANVLLDSAGRAYLADFGIARLVEGSSVATATGMLQGTPSYMAPEQALGEKVGPAADVYALGVMAFECLTGRVPYTGTTPVAVLMKHVHEPVPAPLPGELPPPLGDTLRRALAKRPHERWPTPGAFAAALEQAAAGAPDTVATLPSLDVVPPSEGAGRVERGRGPLLWTALAALAGVVLLVGVSVAFLLRSLPADERPVVTAGSRPGPSPAAAIPTPVPIETPGPVAARGTPPGQRPTPARAPRATPPPVAPPAIPAAAPAPTPVPTPTPALQPAPTPTPEPAAAVALSAGGRPRVHCEARLEAVQFRKTKEKDVLDSLRDLEEALAKRNRVELVPRAQADAIVQVLERGREPAVIGVRKLRVRIVRGGRSVELLGQDSLTGFNTWSGAANGAAKQIESWLERSE
jgi:serine/threonine-protein kinase